MNMIIKNRNRQVPTFANINLLGKCNADCYFCLGKDIKSEVDGTVSKEYFIVEGYLKNRVNKGVSLPT